MAGAPASSPLSASNRKGVWKTAFAGMCVMAAVMGIGRFVFTPMLPQMVEAGAIDIVAGGTLATANYFGYLIGALTASSNRLGNSRAGFLWLGLLLSILTTGLMSIDGGMVYFVIVRFFSGLASAYGMIFVSAIVFETIRKADMDALRALHFSGVGFGIAGSSLVIASMVSGGFSWHSQWFVTAAIAALAAPLLWFWIGENPTKSNHKLIDNIKYNQNGQISEAPSKNHLHTPPGFWLLVISYGLFGFGYIITATFMSVIAKSGPQYAGIANFVWLIVGLSAIPAIWLWNPVADRIGLLTTYVVAMLVEAVGVALSVMFSSAGALLATAIMLGATFVPITAIGFAIIQQYFHGDQGSGGNLRRAIAIMTVAFSLGQMIGPWVAAVLFSQTGNFSLASFMAVGALIIGAAIAFICPSPAKS